VIEVLEPFEVADSDTSCIAENVRQKLDSLLEEDLFSLKSGGAVGGFNDEPGLEPVGIVDVDGFFEGSGDEEIAE
jgi:hypothetical protein